MVLISLYSHQWLSSLSLFSNSCDVLDDASPCLVPIIQHGGWPRMGIHGQWMLNEQIMFHQCIQSWYSALQHNHAGLSITPVLHPVQMEKAMAPHSSTLAWKIPWMEEPGRLQSMGLLRVGYNRATSLSLFTLMHWRRKQQPTPVFLPGESQGWGSLVGCHLWGRTESDTTEVTWQQQQQHTHC